MDEIVAEYIRRTVLKIPRDEIKTMLQKWDFLSEAELEHINFHQIKENIAQEVVQLCEENSTGIKQAAVLDIIYNHSYPNKRMWSVYQMKKTGEETEFFDLTDFKKKFRRQLQSALKNVTVNFKVYEDNAIWIRIAWGTPYKKPNQYKTSYVVYHSQTPYVFVSVSILKSNLPLLLQALIVASDYHDIHEMELRSHSLNSLKDIVFKRYSQQLTKFTFSSFSLHSHLLLPAVDLRIVEENRSEKERIQRLNSEAFGDGPQPKLEFAQYKLETMFKSDPDMDVLDKKEPFRCLVKFSSPHLLESLKSLAPAGMADAPLSPLLTCIPQKARNYFKIREKKSLPPGSFLSP
ncbi:CENPN protein, partial [Turnix velox]|nr:CENPN protein [Turnix velox]